MLGFLSSRNLTNQLGVRSKIKDIMTAKGVTIDELVQDTGLAKETINRARDSRICLCRLETLDRIAQALGVQVMDLFEPD